MSLWHKEKVKWNIGPFLGQDVRDVIDVTEVDLDFVDTACET